MTFAEMKAVCPWQPIYAVIDGCGESAEIGLYRKNPDDFVEDEILDWPTDWPSWVSTKWLQETIGIEVVIA